jgi:tetratricopeptide (TPR) repeat protein
VNPDHAPTWNNRGNALLSLQRVEDAMASYERALALAPDLPEAKRNRAETLGYLCGSNSPFADTAFSRGVALIEKGQFDIAISQLDEALLVRPNFPDAYTARAAALFGLDRHDEALAHCEVAISLDPEYAPAFELRGAVLYDMNRAEDAVESYEKALAIDPDRPGLAAKRDRVLAELKKLAH